MDPDITNKSKVQQRVASEFKANQFLVLKSMLAFLQVRIGSMMQRLPKVKHSMHSHLDRVRIRLEKISLISLSKHGERMESSARQKEDSFLKEINLCILQAQERTSHLTWSASKRRLLAKLRGAALCSLARQKEVL